MTTSSRDTHHIRVGLVGFGLGGATFHAPLVHATPGLELAAIVTRDAGRRSDAKRRYPAAAIVSSMEDFASLGIELVVISSPSALHAPMAREALSRGWHVVVDKPFAPSVHEAEAIGELAARMGRLAIPFQNRRWDGDFLTLQRLLRRETLGTIHRFESRFERWRGRVKPRWLLPDARKLVEGIVYDIGSHLVDQALVLFGPVLRVNAELARVRPGLGVEDDAFLALEHAGGVRSHLYMSASAAISGPRFTLSGERGSYVRHGLDGQEAALRAGGDPASAGWGAEPPGQWGTLALAAVESPYETVPGAYRQFYAAVHAAITTRSAPPVTVDEAIAALAVMEAAFQSAELRRVVEVQERRETGT